jgi:tetratricopeptide (TPR) repeat protein
MAAMSPRALAALACWLAWGALADAWFDLGAAHLAAGDDAQALAAFTRSAQLAPAPANAWLWAALAAERLGRASEAARDRELALAALPAPPPRLPEPTACGPEPCGRETESAFEHFFGASRAADPEPAPDPEVTAAPPAPGEPSAFDYFFGERRSRRGESSPEPEKKPPV